MCIRDRYEEPAAPAQQLAETIQQQVVTGSTMRGSAEYRRHLTGVLVRRAAEELENREMCIRDRP